MDATVSSTSLRPPPGISASVFTTSPKRSAKSAPLAQMTAKSGTRTGRFFLITACSGIRKSTRPSLRRPASARRRSLAAEQVATPETVEVAHVVRQRIGEIAVEARGEAERLMQIGFRLLNERLFGLVVVGPQHRSGV